VSLSAITTRKMSEKDMETVVLVDEY